MNNEDQPYKHLYVRHHATFSEGKRHDTWSLETFHQERELWEKKTDYNLRGNTVGCNYLEHRQSLKLGDS